VSAMPTPTPTSTGPPAIRPAEWLEHLSSEYLESFIAGGGSAVKFAVDLDGRAEELMDAITDRAGRAGHLVARVDAAKTKVHMVDQVFFRIAEQVDWGRSSERVLARLAERAAYRPPAEGEDSFVERLAAANGIDTDYALQELRPQIARQVFQDVALSRDFRVAMSHLCRGRLVGGADGEMTVKTLTDWLTGANKAIAAVKPYHIFSRINRSNARHLFESMLHWVRRSGHAGIVVLLDVSRITVPRNPKDGEVWYTKAAVLDAYEVLRQFIDSTDRLEGCLIVVLPDPAFLGDEARGLAAYEALKFRVYDEVRDRTRVNPLASLVRLARSAAPNAGGGS
jgi:hypothetical protein